MTTGGPFAAAMLLTYIMLACCGPTHIVSDVRGMFSYVAGGVCIIVWMVPAIPLRV